MLSGISSTNSGYSTTTTSSSSSASESRRIQRQIEELQKQLEEVQEDDELDAETKEQQIQLYQTQIMQLQVQLTNIAIAAANESNNAAGSGASTAPAPNAKAAMQGTAMPLRAEGTFQAPPAPPMSPENLINNLSDEDFLALLKDIQEKTGSIPGAEEDIDLSELSSEELQELRTSFVDEIKNNFKPRPEMMRHHANASYESLRQETGEEEHLLWEQR